MTLLSGVSGARSWLLKRVETCPGESGGVSNSDPIEGGTMEIPGRSQKHRTQTERVGQHTHVFARITRTLSSQESTPGLLRQHSTVSMMTVKTPSIQAR